MSPVQNFGERCIKSPPTASNLVQGSSGVGLLPQQLALFRSAREGLIKGGTIHV
jgi:hypothetical protein